MAIKRHCDMCDKDLGDSNNFYKLTVEYAGTKQLYMELCTSCGLIIDGAIAKENTR